MKRSTLYPLLVTVVICIAPLLVAAEKVGEAAPAFTATASNGKTFRLQDYRGKYIVLEWHNNGCPYVGKHYKSGNIATPAKTVDRAERCLVHDYLFGARKTRVRDRERRERIPW